tara:strand:+ start:4086 stop:5585 length:1500 start_codon:yes stop_codon:yes gene_type:complete
MDDLDKDIDAKIEAQTDAEIKRLAGLPEIKYEQERTEVAKSLEVRASVLDKLVKQTRVELAVTESSHDEVVSDIEPWDSPVDGNAVVIEMVELLRRHTVLPSMGHEAIALWCAGTYVYDAFRIFPRLCLHSPQKRCGKTTTLEVIEALSRRTLIASNVSASVIFRAIEAWHPTILADEADTWIHNNEEIRGVINSGHTRRTARVFRTEEVNGQRIPVSFSTWAPLALAMIKTPPDTIMDRSVVVNLRRRMRNEHVHKLPVSLFDDQVDIRHKLARWALDNMDELRRSQPEIPAGGNDRAEDNWHSLFAIAGLLGGDWPKTVVTTMKTLEGAKPDDEDVAAMLLEDIQSIFSDWNHDNIFSEDLVNQLIDLESRPWCEWRRGQPMTKNSLSKMLKPYKIVSNTVRIDLRTAKGFRLTAFDDAFNRYLSPPRNVTTSQTNGGVAPECDVLKTANVTNTPETSQRHTNVTPKPSDGKGCDDVTLETPKYGGNVTPPTAEDFG